MAEPDRVAQLAGMAQPQFQVFFADQALLQHVDLVEEHRRLEALAPDLGVQRGDRGQVEVFPRQRAVGGQTAVQRRGLQPFQRHLLQRAGKGRPVAFGHGAAGGHGVAAKAQQQTRVALADQIQRVAQVEAGDRPARALQQPVLAPRQHEGGPVQPVLQPPGDDADHAFVESRVEQHQRCRRGGAVDLGCQHRVEQHLGLPPHVGLDLAPLAVDGVELLRQFGGAQRVVGGQAFDAQRHVREAAGGVDARPQCKAEVEARGACRHPPGRREQCRHASLHAPGAHPLQALRHQAAVVAVQPHHVGYRAQRHQVEQGVQLGLVGGVEQAAAALLGAQRQQHVEHHADAGQGLALETAAGLAGVDDDVGVGQLHRAFAVDGRQMVVGHQHLQAAGAGMGHAGAAGDAVVHRHQQLRRPGRITRHRQVDDGRRQAVAMHRAVGHHVADAGGGRAQHHQAAQRHGAGGGAVAVVVGHDADATAGGDGVGQQPGGLGRAFERAGRQQPGQAVVQLVD